ncbi:hypothetical protein Q5424_10100 [Conexibacter sp. JD483]|uniref:hypothetical protein n=1 Tax=unclassified Conexibacter TaxID=2627773 RepID=UPI00272051E6|nr:MULTISPECIES: hypothetical protein [unclassified Conexibacter]MDO8188343.1 hypothetical protein [Conexibacter sp. CPCC 205706]MDO8200709.1 hypothetical protein [Conexibacter sp. CPCC 205762]MDR9369433.1 hypothetical protein [Conexibacter sp. JD483]
MNVLIAGAVAIVVALIGGGFALLSGGGGPSFTATGGQVTSGDGCIGSGNVLQGSTVDCSRTTPPARPTVTTPAPTTADAGCGTIEGNPARTAFRMRVVMWCAPIAVRGQYQYKLKVSVRNTGRAKLDIRRERFVLLWRVLDPSRWSPPSGGEPAPPARVRYAEREYWAISANLDGVGEDVPDRPGATFATHWGYSWLDPGELSLRPRRPAAKVSYLDRDGQLRTIRFNFHEDDLVFYVPAGAVDRDRNFLGLGYYDGRRIVAVCPQGAWGPRVPANAF